MNISKTEVEKNIKSSLEVDINETFDLCSLTSKYNLYLVNNNCGGVCTHGHNNA